MRLVKIGDRTVNMEQVLYITQKQETRQRRLETPPKDTVKDHVGSEDPSVTVYTIHFVGSNETFKVPDEGTAELEAFLQRAGNN